MARKKPNPPPMGDIAELEHRQKVAERQSRIDVITPEQSAKGIYHGDGRRIINRGGEPVERWVWGGKLNETQQLAIGVCIRLWEKAGLKQRITQSYEGATARTASDWAEGRARGEIDARRLLGELRKDIPAHYWDVFENVCRHGEPAGVAGGRLGYGSRSAQDRAHQIVCVVADLIAHRLGLDNGRGLC